MLTRRRWRWICIHEPRFGVGGIESKGIDMIENILDVSGGDGKAQAVHERHLGVDDADDLTVTVEKGSAGIARINRCIDLAVQNPAMMAMGAADDTFGDGLFETEWVADNENSFAVGGRVRWWENRRLDVWRGRFDP